MTAYRDSFNFKCENKDVLLFLWISLWANSSILEKMIVPQLGKELITFYELQYSFSYSQ
jgi:hypothetical protein